MCDGHLNLLFPGSHVDPCTENSATIKCFDMEASTAGGPLETRSYLINGFRLFQMEELSTMSTREGFVLRPFCLVAIYSIGLACKIFIFMR